MMELMEMMEQLIINRIKFGCGFGFKSVILKELRYPHSHH